MTCLSNSRTVWLCAATWVAIAIGAPTPNAMASDIDDRRSVVLSLAKENTPKLASTKTGAYEILAATATRGCQDPYWPKYMAHTLQLNPGENEERLSYDLFAMPPLTRYIFSYHSCIDNDQLRDIKNSLGQSKDIFSHGTLNHAIMKLSSFYLLAQYFNDVRWSDIDGSSYTSNEVMSKFKSLLLSRTKGMFQFGFFESTSPIYIAVNIVPLLNLIDFAKDPDVKKAAQDQLVLLLSMLRASAFDGRVVPPIARSTVHQIAVYRSGQADYSTVGAQLILWFYFGDPDLPLDNINDRRVPNYLSIAALSSWTPPSAVLELGDLAIPPYDIHAEIPRFSYWGAPSPPQMIGNSFVSRNYAIGAGNTIFDPSGYNEADQVFGLMFRAGRPASLVDCYHPYWLSNEGPDAWRYDRSSPFQQVFRDGSRGVLIFHIPHSDPYRYIFNRFYQKRDKNADSLFQLQQCRYPKNVDEIIIENNIVTMRIGSAFAGLRSLSAPFETGPSVNRWDMKYFRTLTARAATNGIYFRVAEASEYGSLDEFRRSFESDNVYMQGPSVTFKSASGDTFDVRFNSSARADGWVNSVPTVRRNGVQITDDAIGVPFSTPFLTLDHGELSIFKEGNKIYSIKP